jgi:hypothetical protein
MAFKMILQSILSSYITKLLPDLMGMQNFREIFQVFFASAVDKELDAVIFFTSYTEKSSIYLFYQ